MLEPQSTRFWHAALRSALIDATGLEACWQAIPEARRTPDAVDRRFARQTVTAGYLTVWQAQQILSGRSTNFQIDKYLLLDRIGQGGMGRVYLAKDTRLNRSVALKVLSPDRLNNPRALARFQREAKVGAQLQHENLVRIYDEGDCNGIRYLVMEYIEGRNAGKLIMEKGPLPPAVAARIVRQVAMGLEHAHQKGLIHRDVNPFNILLTRDGTAKLTDLGLAIDLGDKEDAVTRDGATVGTFDYISPEQARHSRSVDTRSDIYSLGCTLFHLLTGRVPFPVPSLPEKLYAHQSSEVEKPSSLVPGIPAGLDQVLRKMMKKAPEDRYPDPGAVARALEPFARSNTPAVEPAIAAATVPSALVKVSIPPGGAAPDNPASGPGTPGSAPADSPSSPYPDEPLETEFQHSIPALDYGPVPPLSDSVSAVMDGTPPGLAVGNGLKIGLGVVAVLVLSLGMIVAVRGCGEVGGTRQSQASAAPVRPVDSDRSPHQSPGPAEPAAVSVQWADGTEKAFQSGDAFNDLREAIQTAAARGAQIVLRNRKPLAIKVTRSLISSGDKLVIRAGKNERPILFLEMMTEEPFLIAKADTPDSQLVLEGLTFEVAYAAHHAGSPLIQAAGNVRFERCAFSLSGTTRATRAALVEGTTNTFTGCWFEGFSRSIEVVAHEGSRTTLSHCMLIQERAGERAGGWGVLARRRGGEGSVPDQNRRLSFDHCTVIGDGLLEEVEFFPQSQLHVTIADTSVRAQALLMCVPSDGGFEKSLRWLGQANRYDISGAAWVVSPPSGPDSLPDGIPASPTDLESWVKAIHDEAGTQVASLHFAADASRASAHQPKDYGPSSSEKGAVGADPERVGPRSGSAKP